MANWKMGLGAAVLCLMVGPAAAEMSCFFERECFDGDTCVPTTYEMEMRDGDPAQLVIEHAELDVEAAKDGTWLARGFGMSVLMSVGEDGNARASFHLPGPQVVVYLGRCEEGE